MVEVQFIEFEKIPRWSRPITVSEKIDGTNSVIYVPGNPDEPLIAGSRSRWITDLKQDNHGFARWVEAHKVELRDLGVGYHRGEWWGLGINRGYGMKEKHWSLINSGKWGKQDNKVAPPACCDIVPVLYEGMMDEHEILGCLWRLEKNGSAAAPGFMKPEGIVIYHIQGNLYFKKTLENDEKGKPEGS